MSKIEVNAIEPQCGTTLTVGASGDTITFPSGTTVVNNGTQTGFGRTGTVDWQTGDIKTGDFTAANGEGYFVNTTSGAVIMTLPSSPSSGDIVAVADYANTAETNNITIARNGSNIEGSASDITISNSGISMTFVYVDSTKGWKTVSAGELSDREPVPELITATGGSIATCGDYKIHTFTGPGTFCVSSGSGNLAVVDYRVVAGGGAGGAVSGGGGAGGGHRTNYPSSCSGIPVTPGGIPVTVGAGGSAQSNNFGNPGSNSIFSSITSAGGGGGGGGGDGPGGGNTGRSGGSGGGGGGNGPDGSGANPGGSGNSPPVSPSQGNNGGPSAPSPASGIRHGGGGGGAGATGGTSPTPNRGGFGGNGTANSITGSPVTYAGGGGGGSRSPSFGTSGPSAPGGSGGGGYGGGGPDGGANGAAGSTNQGGGGGGGEYTNGGASTGSNGGSGIVIIRYKFQ